MNKAVYNWFCEHLQLSLALLPEFKKHYRQHSDSWRRLKEVCQKYHAEPWVWQQPDPLSFITKAEINAWMALSPKDQQILDLWFEQ